MRLALCALFIFLLTGCSTVEQKRVNTAMLAASTASLVADWGQTRWISDHYPQHTETNKILGEHPHKDRVDAYFGAWVIGNALMYAYLPEKLQPYWFGGVLAVEVYCIGHNRKLGVGFNFGL